MLKIIRLIDMFYIYIVTKFLSYNFYLKQYDCFGTRKTKVPNSNIQNWSVPSIL